MKPVAGGLTFLFLLVILSMLGPLTLNILLPSLPGMVVDLKAPKESVQLTLSLYLVGTAVSQLFLGPLADRFGRRPVVLWALVLYVIASLAAFFAPNVELLIIARITQSFGASAGLSLGRTMIRDRHDQNSAASLIGYVTMAMVVAPMLAPSIGALIDIHFGWRAILLACSLLGVASFLVALNRLPETRPATLVAVTGREVVRRSLALIGNGQFMAFWAASGFCSGMFFAFLGAAPYLMIEALGRDKTEYGLWFMSLSIGYAIGNFVSGRYARNLGISRLIFLGNLIGISGTILLLICALLGYFSPLTLFIPAMVTTFGNGLVMPNAISGGIGVDAKAAGAASGLMGFGQSCIGAIMSFLAGSFATQSPLPLALLMAGCAVAAYISARMTQTPRMDTPTS